MPDMTPSLSLKRSSPDDEAIPSLDSTQNTISSPSKRQCRSPQTAPTPRLRFPIPSRDVPSGTPQSSLVTAGDKPTLRLVIPQEPLSHKLHKRIDRHKRDAERWKPKLQRPYPKDHEIKKAYPLKLMRHYPSKPGQQVQPAIKIPKVIKNHRVPQPLKESSTQEAVKREDATSVDADRIPDPGTPFCQPKTFIERKRDLKCARRGIEEVQRNKMRTRCEYAQRLA
ncbi:hypothetical protein E8E13_009164 [Curvularia kusanoi]|uniref:Uncharacterized protein n=1 Tax=Curvularia kusanoi TaxID=90978 RepID=A0A9P4W6I8_CURKU|nr:hypothetical protein E8E13_009164 [Curvularia kusanoi]